ncbi:MAG: hypothetical protein IT454_10160 [Planctomycetes bacterium]|nr:hypothetical protein [Planctomycetota bacterium]
MSSERIYVDGELFLRLETVAEIYRVRVEWLGEACDRGLVAHATPGGSTRCIAAVELDRVATLVRLHLGLGLDLRRIAREWAAREDD